MKQGNIFTRIAKRIVATIKALFRSTAMQPGGAPGQMPTVDIPTIGAELEEGDEALEANGATYENVRIAKLVQRYNTAFDNMDYVERMEASMGMPMHIKSWVSRLSDNDRAILTNCSAAQIANHISGIDPIEDVVACGQGVPYAPRPRQTFGKRHANENDKPMKSEDKPDFTSNMKFDKPEPSKTPDVGLWAVDYENRGFTKQELALAAFMERQDELRDQKRANYVQTASVGFH